MKKLLIILFFLFVLSGCIDPVIPSEIIYTPVESIPTPVESTPILEPLTFDELLLLYKNFIDANLFDFNQPTGNPYYNISSFQEYVTKESLIETYQALDHQSIDLMYANIYYVQIFFYMDAYFQDCQTTGTSFTCEQETLSSFNDVVTHVEMEENCLSIETHMYLTYDGVEYGFHRYYTLDLIDGVIFIEAIEIKTKQEGELDVEVSTKVHVKIVEDQSFEMMYYSKSFDLFVYTHKNVVEQIDVSFVSSPDVSSFQYYDRFSQMRRSKHFLTNQIYNYTEYYVDGILALTHYQDTHQHTLIYNLMMVEGWSQMVRNVDGSRVLWIETDMGPVLAEDDLRLSFSIYDKIPALLMRAHEDLSSIDVDLSDLNLLFLNVTSEMVMSNQNQFADHIESTMLAYGIDSFESSSMTAFDAILDPFVAPAIAHHDAHLLTLE